LAVIAIQIRAVPAEIRPFSKSGSNPAQIRLQPKFWPDLKKSTMLLDKVLVKRFGGIQRHFTGRKVPVLT